MGESKYDEGEWWGWVRPKVYHRGHLVNSDGGVSALCFKSPRPINLAVAMWTNRDDAVTCPKCKAMLRARESQNTSGEASNG